MDGVKSNANYEANVLSQCWQYLVKGMNVFKGYSKLTKWLTWCNFGVFFIILSMHVSPVFCFSSWISSTFGQLGFWPLGFAKFQTFLVSGFGFWDRNIGLGIQKTWLVTGSSNIVSSSNMKCETFGRLF